MAEFFQNKFVIKIDGGHPGYRDYTIIATREDMAQMVREISQALTQSEEGQPSPPQAGPILTELWNNWATIAYGETSRISLTFALSPDLDAYHVRPRRIRKLLSFLGCLGITAVLILALVGLRAVIKSFIP